MTDFTGFIQVSAEPRESHVEQIVRNVDQNKPFIAIVEDDFKQNAMLVVRYAVSQGIPLNNIVVIGKSNQDLGGNTINYLPMNDVVIDSLIEHGKNGLHIRWVLDYKLDEMSTSTYPNGEAIAIAAIGMNQSALILTANRELIKNNNGDYPVISKPFAADDRSTTAFIHFISGIEN